MVIFFMLWRSERVDFRELVDLISEFVSCFEREYLVIYP